MKKVFTFCISILSYSNRHKSCIEILITQLHLTQKQLLEPTQELYWNFLTSWTYISTTARTDTRVVLKSIFINVNSQRLITSNRHKSCIEIYLLLQSKFFWISSNRHKSCIEIKKTKMGILLLILEPTQELYWNKTLTDLEYIKEKTRTDTRVVLKSKSTTQHMKGFIRLEPTQELYWN